MGILEARRFPCKALWAEKADGYEEGWLSTESYSCGWAPSLPCAQTHSTLLSSPEPVKQHAYWLWAVLQAPVHHLAHCSSHSACYLHIYESASVKSEEDERGSSDFTITPISLSGVFWRAACSAVQAYHEQPEGYGSNLLSCFCKVRVDGLYSGTAQTGSLSSQRKWSPGQCSLALVV